MPHHAGVQAYILPLKSLMMTDERDCDDVAGCRLELRPEVL